MIFLGHPAPGTYVAVIRIPVVGVSDTSLQSYHSDLPDFLVLHRSIYEEFFNWDKLCLTTCTIFWDIIHVISDLPDAPLPLERKRTPNIHATGEIFFHKSNFLGQAIQFRNLLLCYPHDTDPNVLYCMR